MAQIIGIIESTASPTFHMKKGELVVTGTYQGFPNLPFSSIFDVTKTANGSETAGVRTITVTRAASTAYKFTISQEVAPGTGDFGTNRVSVLFRYTSTAAAASDSSITTALTAAINADRRLLMTAVATSSTVVTITTATGYPSFNIYEADSNIALAETTPGVKAVGTAALLTAAGVEGVESGKSYITYAGKLRVFEGTTPVVKDWVLYVESAQTVTALDAILDGSGATGTGSSIEAFVARVGTDQYPTT